MQDMLSGKGTGQFKATKCGFILNPPTVCIVYKVINGMAAAAALTRQGGNGEKTRMRRIDVSKALAKGHGSNNVAHI